MTLGQYGPNECANVKANVFLANHLTAPLPLRAIPEAAAVDNPEDDYCDEIAENIHTAECECHVDFMVLVHANAETGEENSLRSRRSTSQPLPRPLRPPKGVTEGISRFKTDVAKQHHVRRSHDYCAYARSAHFPAVQYIRQLAAPGTPKTKP